MPLLSEQFTTKRFTRLLALPGLVPNNKPLYRKSSRSSIALHSTNLFATDSEMDRAVTNEMRTVSMNRNKLPLFIMLIVLILSGCSSTIESTSDSNESLASLLPIQSLESIEVLLYRSDSQKAQPELILFLSEEREKEKMVIWIHTGSVKSTLAARPQKMYLLRFNYQGSNGIVSQKYLAYVEDVQGNHYVKPFNMMTPELDVDKFSEESIEPIMNQLGKNDWYQVKEAPL